MPDIVHVPVDLSGLDQSDKAQITALFAAIQDGITHYTTDPQTEKSAILYVNEWAERWRLKHYRKGRRGFLYVDLPREEALGRMQTRLHQSMIAQLDFFSTYPCLADGKNSFGTKLKLNEFVFREFLAREPWKLDEWTWDAPRATFTTLGKKRVPTGYKQVNIQVNKELAASVVKTAQTLAIKPAPFIASAFGWGVRYLLPQLARQTG